MVSLRLIVATLALFAVTGVASEAAVAEPVATVVAAGTSGTGTTTATITPAPLLAAAVMESDTIVTAGGLAGILPFASLAAAIAAQAVAAIPAGDDETLRCMATTIYYEAKGEPLDGQLAVAEVILNRARSGRYPSDVCGVVTQAGQFSFVRGGVLPTIDAGRASYVTALAVARVAMAKAWESSAPRALFFHARRVAASARMLRVAAIGNHVFYR